MIVMDDGQIHIRNVLFVSVCCVFSFVCFVCKGQRSTKADEPYGTTAQTESQSVLVKGKERTHTKKRRERVKPQYSVFSIERESEERLVDELNKERFLF